MVRAKGTPRPKSAPRRRSSLAWGVVAVVVGLSAAGCASSSTGSTAADGSVVLGPSSATRAGTAAPPCPTGPVRVTVTVDQWGDVVRHLAGACAEVTTIVTGATGDPHEYEPTPGDAAAFTGARLVVVNGLGYDAWATKLLDSSSSPPEVVDAGAIAGRHEGDNPHVWYSPAVVDDVAGAVTQRLQQLVPVASDYFATQAASWRANYAAVHRLVADVRSKASGKPYAATESVFDDMAAAVGLVDRTPPGYAQAAANESEPAPGDLAALEQVLRDHRAAVLVVNTQTEGSLVDQLRSESEEASVPVVEVTETMPEDVPSFVDWQVGQLESLARRLGPS